MHRGAVLIVVVLSIGIASCGDDVSPGATTTTATTPDLVPAEITVTGVVIAVEGDLAGIDSFVIRLEDGSDLTLVPTDGLLFDGVSPLSHIRDHMVSGSQVQVTYEASVDGLPTATLIGDAEGNSHDD